VSPWIAQHFLNPAVFWPGLALVSIPVIIHLINRLHYRRVRFAAMEFLLASEEKSRRRVLLEQLLLLLLRVLFVLLLVALIGRMVLSAQQLSLFRGAKSHHLVLLDDSGSMRDRSGETTAFDEAKAVIRKLVAEGANRPGTQRFTLLLAWTPTGVTSESRSRSRTTGPGWTGSKRCSWPRCEPRDRCSLHWRPRLTTGCAYSSSSFGGVTRSSS
jgi:hypothetical protein